MASTSETWDPGAYHRFRDLRLRPALDLLGAVGPLPQGDVVDLGCGSGALAAALASRFAPRALIGVDTSEPMLDRASETGCYDRLDQTDIAGWTPRTPPALIYSNAALQWLPDHAALLPRLARLLAPGGWLAVQMPGQNDAPSHAAWRRLSGAPGASGIAAPAQYLDWLAPFGEVRQWETLYEQTLPSEPDRHPVRAFTQSTYGRPFLQAAADPADLEARYDAEMERAYPRRADGSVLFPFRRVFFTLDTAKAARGPGF